MKPYYQTDNGVLYHGDCLEILPQLEPVDLVLTDPPYGIKYDASHKKYKNGVSRDTADWDIKPFDPMPIISLGYKTIMWGGNCFASRLPDNPGWLCWVKTVRDGAKIRQAEMELAWTNCINRPVVFRHLWVGAYRDSESGKRNLHPTQKPMAVIDWCLRLTNPKSVADPYFGSGTTGAVCEKWGIRWIGIEISEKYCELAAKRIEAETRQLKLF